MRRYEVLAAAVVMQACLGGIYAWSAFAGPLRASFGYSAAQTQAVFGTAFLVFTASLIVTGRLQDRFGPRALSLASGLFLGSGYLVLWAAGDGFGGLMVGFGLLVGLGIGCGYVCPIATGVKWFPEHKGLVCGLAVAGYGGGAVVLANLAKWLMAAEWPVRSVFGLVGLVYGLVVIAAGMLLFVPAGSGGSAVRAFRRRDALGDRRFWAVFVGMFCGTLPGLMIIGDLGPMGVWFGAGEWAAVAAISVLAIGNAAGRVLWGLANDRLGGRVSVAASLGLIAVSVAALMALGGGRWGFLAAALAVGLCYGSSFALYPAQVAQVYGPAVLGTVYAMVMVAHGLAAEVGPVVGGWLVDETGSYYPGLAAALATALMGLGGYVWLTRPADRRQR
ncbi:MAG: OFA family MFS transporter [Phycisphaerae bacterium]|nr:OFA family MFS transporter [Phycisphaerae bacterium]